MEDNHGPMFVFLVIMEWFLIAFFLFHVTETWNFLERIIGA